MVNNYTFAGWEFERRDDTGGDMNINVLILWKELKNPHPPDAVLSYKGFGKAYGVEYAAAWLIAHWYEHKLQICPCQNGEEPDANESSLRFRAAFIESLLFYEGVTI